MIRRIGVGLLVSLGVVVSCFASDVAVDGSGEVLLEFSFSRDAEGWATWSPRGEIAPSSTWDGTAGRTAPGALTVGNDGDSTRFGTWRRTVTKLSPGRYYCFSAWFRCSEVDYPIRSVIPRLVWLNDRGKRVRPPEFIAPDEREGDWYRIRYVTQAPETASQLDIQLGFGFSEGGRVWFDDVSLSETDGPGAGRVVRVATVDHRPRGTKDARESLTAFEGKLEEAASLRPDIICLPEGITVVGNPQSYIDVSEAVPGPTTRRLGRLAEKLRSYIVAGIYEREGTAVYNTAVLIDRDGKLAGRYRKTHLPREEWEAGLTPGNEYPVFETDFGKVGLMICWDVQFPEPARAMALKGAELLLLPIWGGSDLLTRARAKENHVFLVSSGYDMRSFIVDPTGAVIAEATDTHPIAVAEVHLDQQLFQPWLGDMSDRTWKERRPDIPIE